MPAYTTPLPQTVLWRDLDTLADEQAVLALFREPQHRYAVETNPPAFQIQKARPLKFETIYWTVATGRIRSEAGQTQVELRVGFTSEAHTRNWVGAVFLLVWPPLWAMFLMPNAWVCALPVTVVLGSIVAATIYWPVWRFRQFLRERWQLTLTK
ncbi:hypothetical protein [Spirosoma montaniterrae]|uniref:Uncharacterized protein n=1 Tax=Spirosoma montaniterrae TaxID=1178516 RepID=A0A1P9WU76_9BACT|nr:hypothetical protein [Spirosoma montaniterrae]AQG78883.1 hypothetical protein AWR27_05815 [Spirosoma montaniterrae]